MRGLQFNPQSGVLLYAEAVKMSLAYFWSRAIRQYIWPLQNYQTGNTYNDNKLPIQVKCIMNNIVLP